MGFEGNRLLGVDTMASRAFLGRRLVKQYLFAFNTPQGLVTAIATHIAMNSLERKGGTRVVIEQRRSPFVRVVAIGACTISVLGELPAVSVSVALLAS